MNRPLRVYSIASSAPQRQALEHLVQSSDALIGIGSGNLASPLPPQTDVVLAEMLPGEEPQQPHQGPPYWVVLADEARSGWLQRGWKQFVRGLLPRLSSESEIELALSAVGQGLLVQHPEMVAESVAEAVSSPLSTREHEVLSLLALGRSNKQIANEMHITEHTVKFHLASIFQKLQASSRSQAIATGIRRGYVSV